MKDYHITVVTKEKPEAKRLKPGPVTVQPGIQGLNSKALRFLKKFDINKNNRITLEEYSGPPKLFKLIDSNHDKILELKELKVFHFKK